MPYGMTETHAYCVNSEPGTFNHECQKPAQWVGTSATGFDACFCDNCKGHGYEAQGVVYWERIN